MRAHFFDPKKLSCNQYLLALAIICFTAVVEAQSRVVWLSLEGSPQPPASAAAEPNTVAIAAPGELARQWLAERLPGFSHVHDSASITRLETLIADDSETYCYANALHTPWRWRSASAKSLLARLNVGSGRGSFFSPVISR